jgi:hypothetical protein
MPIPDWAYRDVLFLLIDYGERAHEIIYGPLSPTDRQEHFEAFLAVGHAMHLSGLPTTYAEYQTQRHQQLLDDYAPSPLMERLCDSYRAAIGPWRYWLLRRIQANLLPTELLPVAGLRPNCLIGGILRCYRYLPGEGSKPRWLYNLLLPSNMSQQVHKLALNVRPG